MLKQAGLKIVLLILFSQVLIMNYGNAGVTGKIAGRVTDRETGDPLAGGNVVVRGVIQNGEEIMFRVDNIRGAATDLDGEYFILNLPPGIYIVESTYMGYEKQVRKDVKVSVDYTTRLDFKLGQTALKGEEVVVTAEREMIRKDLTSSAVTVSAEELQVLPVREVNDVLELQAGVVRDAGGQLHIRGGRTNEIIYLIDGVQVIDPLNRRSGISIDNQAVQELQAITGTFNAEYGQALSGVINIVTKQGSDKFQFNFTGYLGDHLGFDDDNYYVMDNTNWANLAAHDLSNQLSEADYDYFFSGQYDFLSPEVQTEKPHLTRKNYLNNFNPVNNTDLQFNMSGPIPHTNKRLTYFFSGRYYYDPGYSYGKRYFMPWGFSSPVGDTLHSYKLPDNKIVPLRWAEQYSMQSKIFFRPFASLNLSYGLYFTKRENRDGDDSYAYKYLPDFSKIHYNTIQTHIFNLNHALSPKTFYEAKLSYYQKDYNGYLYENPYDHRYMPLERADFEQYVFGLSASSENYNPIIVNPSDFVYFGNDVQRWKNNVSYYTFKFDITSQVTKRHLLKFGAGGQFNDLKNQSYTLQFDQATYRPYIPDPDSSAFFQRYHFKPREFSAYFQDKIEFKELIINVGLRFDYFDSDGRILSDPAEPEIGAPFKQENIYRNYDPEKPESEWGGKYTLEEKEQFWYETAKPKSQVSPRLGISFPITEKGVIHFSYGHFFQTPELRYMYENPKFWVDVTRANVTPRIGNADIEPERTVMYEIGLQQGLSDNLYLHLTGFYRDIRDWIGISAPINTYRGTTYYKYINNDHATVKGVTLNSRLMLRDFSLNFDYTYMIAKGTFSNPQDAYTRAIGQEEPRIQLVNLNWDQRHTLNTTLNYQYKKWSASLIATLNSGLPYTPGFYRGEAVGASTRSGLRENSEIKPTTYNLDLRISRRVNLFGMYAEFLVNVFNLLDTRNARNVYSDTGQPNYTSEGINQVDRNSGLDIEISDVDEYYIRPQNFYPPRFIQLGLRIGL